MKEVNILKYFFQYKSSIDYLEYLTPDIFTDGVYKAIFQVYIAYISKYVSIPDKDNFITFCKNGGIQEDHINIFNQKLGSLYETFTDTPIVEEHLLLHIKKILHTRAVQDSLNHLGDSWDEKAVTKLYKKMAEIDQLDIHNQSKAIDLFDLIKTNQFKLPTPHPTCFRNFNHIIGLNGFFAPQLVTILGGAKSMKTTFMLHLAAGYAKDGLGVAYIDWENGDKQTGTVLQQILLNARVELLYEPYHKEILEQRVSQYLAAGGALKYISLRAKKDKVSVAETELSKLYDKGFVPQALFYDYLDITGADKGIKDRREKIQIAYADAKNVNMQFDCFGITISKLVSGASKKDFHTEDDAGEDREKAYNVDAMFSLHRTEDDVKEGIGWLQPIVQRNGESRTDEKVCFDMDGATRYIGDSNRTFSQ